MKRPGMTDEFKRTLDIPELIKTNAVNEAREQRRRIAKRKSAEFNKTAEVPCDLVNDNKEEASSEDRKIDGDQPVVANCMQWLFAGNCKKHGCGLIHASNLRAAAGEDEGWTSGPDSPMGGHCTDHARTGLCNTEQCRWNSAKMTWRRCDDQTRGDEDEDREHNRERSPQVHNPAPISEDDESPLGPMMSQNTKQNNDGLCKSSTQPQKDPNL